MSKIKNKLDIYKNSNSVANLESKSNNNCLIYKPKQTKDNRISLKEINKYLLSLNNNYNLIKNKEDRINIIIQTDNLRCFKCYNNILECNLLICILCNSLFHNYCEDLFNVKIQLYENNSIVEKKMCKYCFNICCDIQANYVSKNNKLIENNNNNLNYDTSNRISYNYENFDNLDNYNYSISNTKEDYRSIVFKEEYIINNLYRCQKLEEGINVINNQYRNDNSIFIKCFKSFIKKDN